MSTYIKRLFLIAITLFSTMFSVNNAHAFSIINKVTHNISTPSSGDIFSNMTVSWAAKPAYSSINFTEIKLFVTRPNGTTFHQNFGGSSYSFKPSMPGNWCFKVRGIYNSEMGLYGNTSCTNVSDSIVGHYTHNTSSPSSGSIFSNMTVSWSAKSTYSSVNFTEVKLFVTRPNGTTFHQNFGGSSYSFKPSMTGNWCFKVRGIYNSQMGLYGNTSCTNVSDSIVGHYTHNTSSPSSGSIFSNMTVSWSAKSTYSSVNFTEVKLFVTRPNGTTFHQNFGGSSYSFKPSIPGNWCFKVRGIYKSQMGLYGNTSCTQVSDSIINRVTHNISVTPTIPADGTYQVAWTPIDKYKDVAFTHVKLAIKDPDPTVDNIHDNYQPTQTYKFTPTKGGEWCFTVRGSYNGQLGLYNDYQCVIVPDIDTLSTFSVPSRVSPGEQITISWEKLSNSNVEYYQVFGELKGKIAQVSKDTDHIVRAAGAEGREYCYKARAVFANNSEGPFSDTKCTLVSSTNLPVFPEISGIGLTKISEQSFNLSWQEVSGAHRYLVELQTAESISDLNGNRWQPIGYTVSAQLPMSFSAFHQAIYNSMARFTFRVSACNSAGICGNYGRLPVKTLTNTDFLTAVPAEHKVPACIYVPETTAENSAINIQFCPAQAGGVTSYNLYGELAGVIQSGTLSSFTSNAQGLSMAQRPSLPAGKEYCYKVEAMYGTAKGGYSEKLCTVIGDLVFEATAEFIALPSDTTVNQFALLWAPIVGADSYLLERETSFGMWDAHACDIAVTEYNGQTYQSCIVETSNEQLIPEKGKVVYRVSACNSQGQCGNYERVNFEPMAMPPVNSPENLIPHGDFEAGNVFGIKPNSSATIDFETSNPLLGNRSLKATVKYSSYIRYIRDMTGESKKSTLLKLFGYLRVLSSEADHDLFVSIRVKYGPNDTDSYIKQAFPVTSLDTQFVNIELPLDVSKAITSIRVYFSRETCSSCPVTFLMDDFFLGLEGSALKVYRDNSGNLYFKGLPDAEGKLQYFKLERINGTWEYVKLDQAQFDALEGLKEENDFKVLLEDINGDGLIDANVFSNNGAVRIRLLNSNKGFSLEKVKQTLFIHTDLLGSPVAETDFEGGIQ